MNRIKMPTFGWLPALLLLLTVCAAGLAVFLPPRSSQVSAQQPEQVFASAIHAGCYLATPSVCKIKVDPFTIQTSASLVNFKLQANGQTIYDFSTDLSNPPAGNYTPSKVRQDFAAHCGQTYAVNLIAADTSAPSTFYNLGTTRSFTCPQGRYDMYLPTISR